MSYSRDIWEGFLSIHSSLVSCQSVVEQPSAKAALGFVAAHCTAQLGCTRASLVRCVLFEPIDTGCRPQVVFECLELSGYCVGECGN